MIVLTIGCEIYLCAKIHQIGLPLPTGNSLSATCLGVEMRIHCAGAYVLCIWVGKNGAADSAYNI